MMGRAAMPNSSKCTTNSTALLSVIVLTRDEEKNLPHFLESAKALGATFWVVDSGSTDATIEIAKGFGCRTVFHEWSNYAKQLNWAIETLPLDTPWIARMDADETFTPELVAELNESLPSLPAGISGLLFKRRVYFMGRWIRYGGYYPTWLLRVWRNGQGRCEDRAMDEHMIVTGGTTMRLQNDIIDENHKGLTFWIDKHNHYATREMRDLISLNSAAVRGVDPQLVGQAETKRWFKENVYARSPLFLRAVAYWLFRYFVLLGFLDGVRGFIFHFFQAFWYRFLVDAKLYEYRHQANTDNRRA
ncbi:Glycosyl transferase [uncultured Defluviicoccus sp.]|uniref:Glycosyl transferase n=1 Tax=metagenome TaxID=256318 RepID=A0A380TJW4_9ZZZZ|nr:Glycosyl transferase [uncultured Defluviicoccus sp.]